MLRKALDASWSDTVGKDDLLLCFSDLEFLLPVSYFRFPVWSPDLLNVLYILTMTLTLQNIKTDIKQVSKWIENKLNGTE